MGLVAFIPQFRNTPLRGISVSTVERYKSGELMSDCCVTRRQRRGKAVSSDVVDAVVNEFIMLRHQDQRYFK